MIQCARCAAANQPTSKYCLSCGAPLPAAAPAAGPTPPPPANPGAGGAAAPAQGAWGPPGYGQAPNPQPGQAGYAGGAQQGYSPPAPAQPYPNQQGQSEERFRIGSPDGLNPYGATVGPRPAFGETPGAPQYGQQPQQAYAPQQQYAPPQPQYAPQPQNPHAPQYAGSPPQYPTAPAPPVIQPAPGAQYPSRSHDPSAYAPTAPPNRDDLEAPRAWNPPGAPQAHNAPQPRVGSRPPPPLGGRDPEQLEPGSLRMLAGFLVSYDGTELGAFWPIYQGTNVVGRRGAASGLDVEIDNPTTSSRHAVLYASARPARLKIEDTGSTNGTFISDQTIERGKKYEVKDGDLVRFGGFATIVKLV